MSNRPLSALIYPIAMFEHAISTAGFCTRTSALRRWTLVLGETGRAPDKRKATEARYGQPSPLLTSIRSYIHARLT